MAKLKLKRKRNTLSDRAKIVAFPPLIVFLPLGVAILLQQFVPFTPWLWFPPILSWAGLAAIGIMLVLPAALKMKAAGTAVNPYKTTTKLVFKGPYRFSRNPMYVGLFLIYFAATLYFRTTWGLVFFPFVAAAIHFGVVKREEEYLTDKFGRTYTDYTKKVRRYL